MLSNVIEKKLSIDDVAFEKYDLFKEFDIPTEINSDFLIKWANIFNKLLKN